MINEEAYCMVLKEGGLLCTTDRYQTKQNFLIE